MDNYGPEYEKEFLDYMDEFISVFTETFIKLRDVTFEQTAEFLRKHPDSVLIPAFRDWYDQTKSIVTNSLMEKFHSKLKLAGWRIPSDLEAFINKYHRALPNVVEAYVQRLDEEPDLDELVNSIVNNPYEIHSLDDYLEYKKKLETMPEGEEKKKLQQALTMYQRVHQRRWSGVFARRKVVANAAAKLAEDYENELKDKELTLELNFENEVALLASILWRLCYPEDPVEDEAIVSLWRDVLTDVSDPGKLHKTLRSYIAQRLLDLGRVHTTAEAEDNAESLLMDSDYYEDLLRDLYGFAGEIENE